MKTIRKGSAIASAIKKPLLLASTITLLLGALSTASLLTSTARVAQSAEFCQCVAYVANRYGINIPANAKDVGPILAQNGFSQVSAPQIGAVVVMQPSFPGSDPTYGHVGVVEQVNSNGTIAVRGANQSGSQQFSESGCNNVSIVNFGTSVNGRSDVSFWVRETTPSPISGIKTYFIGNYALNTNNYFAKLDGFPIMSSWQRNDADPDQQFERLQGNWGTLLKHKSTGGCLNAHYLYNGAQINVWSACSASDPDQNWTIADLGNGYFHIRRANTNTSFCVDMPYRTNGGRIHLWQCDPNNANQRWRTN